MNIYSQMCQHDNQIKRNNIDRLQANFVTYVVT